MEYKKEADVGVAQLCGGVTVAWWCLYCVHWCVHGVRWHDAVNGSRGGVSLSHVSEGPRGRHRRFPSTQPYHRGRGEASFIGLACLTKGRLGGQEQKCCVLSCV